jgi:UDP-2,4-diacetamido-2,4,6-trideoxy-beta-L-altropyranose hydrolase
MRCLALAQDWSQQSGKTVFAVGSIPEILDNRLKSEGMSITKIASAAGTSEDAAELVATARDLGVTRVALDGYQFGSKYQQAIKDGGLRTLFIDDYGHAEWYFADLILNQNLYADESMYNRRNKTTQLLLGTRYALLRREFLSWSAWSRCIPALARRLLVTLGGSDSSNTTSKVIRSLHDLKVPDLEVRILLGPANRHHEAVRQAVGQRPERFQILTAEADMPRMMAWADLAISAAGSTCWELAFMGLPTVTVELAENQRPIAKSLADAGISTAAGWYSDLDAGRLTETIARLVTSAAERGEMSRRGRAIVDGHGARRASQSLMHADVEVC